MPLRGSRGLSPTKSLLIKLQEIRIFGKVTPVHSNFPSNIDFQNARNCKNVKIHVFL